MDTVPSQTMSHQELQEKRSSMSSSSCIHQSQAIVCESKPLLVAWQS